MMNTYWHNYVRVLKKYVIFEGRASRREFWMYVLVNLIFSMVAGIISPTFGALYGLLVFLPSLAVAARRLHDAGRSEGWLLIGLIPFIGVLVLIILFLQPSQRSA